MRWLDLVALKYTTMLNGVTDLIMMKSDVQGMPLRRSKYVLLMMCMGARLPRCLLNWRKMWSLSTRYLRVEDMTSALRNWLQWGVLIPIKFIETYLVYSYTLVSVGPDRHRQSYVIVTELCQWLIYWCLGWWYWVCWSSETSIVYSKNIIKYGLIVVWQPRWQRKCCRRMKERREGNISRWSIDRPLQSCQ